MSSVRAALAVAAACIASVARAKLSDPVDLANTAVWETRGYFKRELSLVKPYQGSGMDVPWWDIGGSTMISGNYIRLTSDSKSRQGAVWNQVPVSSRDWELHVTFRVHGSTGDLFGDGMAVWYARDKAVPGAVFGSKDYFVGMGIFLDTYSNHNGPHGHGHPWISAMVNNGSAHYDHDRDGTHTQLGGDHSGCEAKFRNKDFDANMLVRYVADTLSIYTDINNKGVWEGCVSVPGVRLPTGFHFGVSAATGDLSDNHDVISVRYYEIDYQRVPGADDLSQGLDASRIEPSADVVAAPRDHVDEPPPSKLGWIGKATLIVVAVVACVGALGIGFVFFKQRHDRSKKRFY